MKRMLLPMLALVVAVSLSAFTASKHETKKVDGQLWYDFVGDDPSDPGDYILGAESGTQEPECNANTNVRCAVLAEQGTSGHPDLDDPNIQIRNKTQQ